MKDSCVIKSNKYGLSLLLNPEISFEQLVTDVCRKFLNAKEFFGKTELVVSMSGRDLTFEEQEVIIQAIELNSDIKVKLIQENDEITERSMLGKLEKYHFDRINEHAKIIFGDVHNTVHSDLSVVVLGDISEEAEVNSKGNIIVFGKIFGGAHAGAAGNDTQFIVCHSLESDDISIGNHIEEVAIEKSIFKRFKRLKSEGIIIGVWDDSLIAEPLANGLLQEIVSKQ